MAQAFYLPSQLNDLSVDVSLGTPAQGAVMYRGAVQWNALAAGTSGQVLTSGGVGHNPSWSNITPGMGAVVTAPTTTAQNTIIPAADSVNALTLQQHSATQSAPLMEFLDSLGQNFLNIGPGEFFSFFDHATGISTFILNRPGSNGFSVFLGSASPTDVGLAAFAGAANTTADIFQTLDWNFGNPLFGVASTDGTTSRVYYGAGTSTGVGEQLFQILTTLPVPTTATFTSRSQFQMLDHAALREAMRMEANGSAAALGFYGHAAATQPTVTGSRSGNAALASLLTALASQGLVIDNSTA